MGLDTSHDAWHGAYSAFARWRHEIAKIAGYWVLPVTYDDGYTSPTVMIDWGHLPEGALRGNWGRVVPGDALLYLIAHSDCDGHLKPAACGRLADRLEELLPQVEQIPDDAGHIGKWGQKTRQFIDGLRAAHAEGKRLRFG